MKFSVIVPYFDRPRHLARTLSGLAAQPNVDFEVIVVDDGSPVKFDLSGVAAGLRARTTYLYFERGEKSGAGFARNRGIDVAQGDYLVFLDCDMVVPPDYLSQVQRCFEFADFPESIFQIGTRKNVGPGQEALYEGDLATLETRKDIRHDVFAIYSQNLGQLASSWHLGFTNNLAVSRRLALDVGGFDEGFVGWGLEDCEFCYRLTLKGGLAVYNPMIEAYHLYHEEKFDERRHLQWKRNLDYFISRHPNIPVELQRVFSEFYDPQVRNLLELSGVKDTWLNAFCKFEDCLKRVNFTTDWISQTTKSFLVPSIKEIRDYLEEEVSRTCQVICPKDRMDLVTWVQTTEDRTRIKLFAI